MSPTVKNAAKSVLKFVAILIVALVGYAIVVAHQSHMIVESVSQAVGNMLAANQQQEARQSSDVFSVHFGADGKGEGYLRFPVEGTVQSARVDVDPNDAWRASAPRVVETSSPPPPEPVVVYPPQQPVGDGDCHGSRPPPQRQEVRCKCLACHRGGGQERTAARPAVTRWVGYNLQP